MFTTGANYDVVEIGYNTPKEVKTKELKAGEVGFVCASIKTIDSVRVGDTITTNNNPKSPTEIRVFFKNLVTPATIFAFASIEFEAIRSIVYSLS